jgi:hypothetical protein
VRLLEGLAGILGADVATFARVADVLRPDFQASVGWDDDFRRTVVGYIARFGPGADPLAYALMSNPEHGALARRDVSADRDWYRSEYYAQIKRRTST